MATDYFISYSQAQKVALLEGLTQAMLTGQVTSVQTAPGKSTQFNPNLDNSLMYARLCDSIASDPAFDATDPIQAKCKGNARPGVTRVKYLR